ncbi:MAG TPA: PIN domain-containing protein [Roseiflexaceae bacterium]|nr:PIN domain-containing protein [Roseiflexaceae bacterium]
MYTIDTSVFINAVEPLETDHAASRQLLGDALAQHAATLAAAHPLRGADAVYAAVAHHFGATLVSRDREHLTRLPAVVPVLHPTDALARLQAMTT